MADQLDNRPVFTIVMGCNGAGKSAWKRGNYDRLPSRYFDQDSIAGGIGDWNSEEARERTRTYVEAETEAAMRECLDFGIESTCSGAPGPAMLRKAKAAGYRIEGVYIGTSSAEINIERVNHRVESETGHWVDPKRIPERYKFSLSNLRKTGELFDNLEIIDNSEHDERRKPVPREQIRLERGVVKERSDPLERWCSAWLERFEKSLRDRTGRGRKTPAPVRGGSTPGGGPGSRSGVGDWNR